MLRNLKTQLSQRGVTLTELLLSISIIAMMMFTVMRFYKPVNEGRRLNAGIADAQMILTAARNLLVGNPTGEVSIAKLHDADRLDDDLCGTGGIASCTGLGANPWGGDLSVDNVKQDKGPYLITVTMTNVNTSSCKVAHNAMKIATVACPGTDATTKMTVTAPVQ